ncbi:hypothetical protein H5410_027561 [Solanum commersonii]|uniref:Uncharacterized protein n=1 Tax=Solanum commersonii TaxID=4109 RepID=A0A9J5Z1L2_SOLCO|nr:hypothetical protein H5410_027561 [Solanum commersonii]
MYKPHTGASPESSDNSSKLRRIEAIHVAISEQELDWARKIISLENTGMIHVKTPGNLESTSNDLSSVQKSKISTDPIERSTKAMLEGIAWESSDVRPVLTSSRVNETLTRESSRAGGFIFAEISNHLMRESA